MKVLAADQVYWSATANEPSLVDNFRLELFLDACTLSTTDQPETTLDCLRCSGKLEESFNTFIVPRANTDPGEDKPHSIWGCECPNRGTACFQTWKLFKMSKSTGGYAVAPSSRSLLFQPFLLQPFLGISARPEIAQVLVQHPYQASMPKIPGVKDVYDFAALPSLCVARR